MTPRPWSERGVRCSPVRARTPSRRSSGSSAVYVDHLTAWDPALLREVIAASFQRTGGSEVTAELARLDERLIEQMATLVGGFQERDRMRRDVDPMEATLLLFSALVTQLIMFLALEGFDPSTLSAQLNRQVELAFTGLQGDGHDTP